MTSVRKKYKPETVRAAFHKWLTGDVSPDGEYRAFCPVCEDPNTSHSPSASFNIDGGFWNCLKGNHGGSIYNLVQDMKAASGFDLRAEALKNKNLHDKDFIGARNSGLKRVGREGKEATPLPDAAQIAAWTDRLIRDKTRLTAFMEQRGIDEAMILRCHIGWDGFRYTIPVYGEKGEILNVRRYKMNADHASKMLNIPGHGDQQLFGWNILKNERTVILTEGETDCILGWMYGLPTVTHTGGAKTFNKAFGMYFTGKTVYICYDNDEAGDKGVITVTRVLSDYATAVYKIKIPIDRPGADLTDFLHKEGNSVEDFYHLMSEAANGGSLVQKKELEPLQEDGVPTSLTESMSPDAQHQTMKLTVSVAGKQAEPFTAPRTIVATCDMSKNNLCTACPVGLANGNFETVLREDDESLARFVDIPETRRRVLLREVSRARCQDAVEFAVKDGYYIEELLVQPSIDDRVDDETQTPLKRSVFSIGTYRSDVNTKVELIGRNIPDPKSGRLRFSAWRNRRVNMDIDKFEFTEEVYRILQKFRASEGQSPLDKCFEIAADMSENVTHIYGRDLLHVAYDLVWHSALTFKVGDLTVDKGWLEIGVFGDTRTGKSEIANRLIKHYRAGTLLSCEGMSFAGIVGGVQQIDGRWHMTWGAVPMNDRRLVVLDEMSGLADKGVIEQMSSIRSSGIAQITKIQSEQTSARTRLIWIANPADGSFLASQSEGGLWAMRSNVPNNEDIARFDFVTTAARGDVSDDIINSSFEERHDPFYSSAECELLVKWIWSRTKADVVISQAAAKAAILAARDMGARYIPDPPLVQSENVRYKILRVAAAIAARTFSADKAGRLLVRSEHVRDAVRFLDMTYGQDSLGYARRSRRAHEAEAVARTRRQDCYNFLKGEPEILNVLRMVSGSVFKRSDLKNYSGAQEETINLVLTKFAEWRMITIRTRGEYGISPLLQSVLKELEDEDV